MEGWLQARGLAGARCQRTRPSQRPMPIGRGGRGAGLQEALGSDAVGLLGHGAARAAQTRPAHYASRGTNFNFGQALDGFGSVARLAEVLYFAYVS
jgi:hypothetical protein